MPYHIRFQGRSQTIDFAPLPTRLQDIRKVTQRQLRDAMRAAKREKRLRSKPDAVTEALQYADLLGRNPELTKARLAEELGVPRIRVYQMLGILGLPQPILDFIQAHDSTEWKAVLTERRLRPLTQLASEAEQVSRFRQLLGTVGLRS